MRKYGWEDFALPLVLLFAVTFALTLRHQITLLAAATPAMASTEVQPDYVITVTAKRLPPECKGAARAPSCNRFLAGEARMEIREGTTRFAERAAADAYAY